MTFKNFTLKELLFLKKVGLDKYNNKCQYLIFGTELETVMNHPEYYKGRDLPVYLVDLVDKGCVVITSPKEFDSGNYVGKLVSTTHDAILYRMSKSIEPLLMPVQIRYKGALPREVITEANYRYRHNLHYKTMEF